MFYLQKYIFAPINGSELGTGIVPFVGRSLAMCVISGILELQEYKALYLSLSAITIPGFDLLADNIKSILKIEKSNLFKNIAMLDAYNPKLS